MTTKATLLDLLEETLPFLNLLVGGANVDDTLRKVAMVLQLAGRKPNYVPLLGELRNQS